LPESGYLTLYFNKVSGTTISNIFLILVLVKQAQCLLVKAFGHPVIER